MAETNMPKIVAYTFPNTMVLYTGSSIDNNKFISFFRASENVVAFLDDYIEQNAPCKAIYSDVEGATILKLKYPDEEAMYSAMHQWQTPTPLHVS